MREHWEREAENWVAWARTPGHDAYWQYAPVFFDEIVPGPSGPTLEVGCGEGRVARDLARRGHRVVGIDAAPTLVARAREADRSGSYLVCDAARLPFTDGSFDVAVAYNSLMDMDDMPAAIAEVARILRRGGRFCVCVTHPIADAGRFEGADPDALFVIAGSYLAERRPYRATFERGGLGMTFDGWCYPLESYARALEQAGLLIERLREPARPSTDARPEKERWRRLPVFLFFRAVKGG